MAGIGYILSVAVYGVIALVILIGLACRFFRDYCKKAKTVETTLIHKESFNRQTMFKSMAPKNAKCFVLTFMAEEKLSFYVPEAIYELYQPEEKGVLTYQGSRFIGFQILSDEEIQKNA